MKNNDINQSDSMKSNATTDTNKKKSELIDGDYKRFFFRHASVLTWILFGLGLISAVLIFLITKDPFKSAAVIFLLIWLVVFLRYFLWAVYHYNVNYGYTIRDWEKIEDAKQRLKNGEVVLQSELEEPKFNPYRSQTFGVPPGTVRGMLAFTLLFGAISILISSMGMEQGLLENPTLRYQFEFFETAFLMMMAFYFGDKSLRFLQSRWKDNTPTSNNTPENNSQDRPSDAAPGAKTTNLAGNLKSQDEQFIQEDAAFAAKEGLEDKTKDLSLLKDTLNTFSASTIASTEKESAKVEEEDLVAEFGEDGQGQRNYPCTPIIDAGHGGTIDGEYTTGNKKRYKFIGTDEEFEVLEGVVNRKIAKKLIKKLEENGIPYYSLNVFEEEDLKLSERVAEANRMYTKDKSVYYLSLHSNAASPSLQGKGTTANGIEIWTSVNETPSDQLARIAKREYQKFFNGKFKFRGLKEKNLYVLKHTRCPAMLVENLFFDNYQEAKYLMSDEGQDELAECLFNVIKSILYYYED
ncbi:N-acetylmuramoyl-L-alanine amidase [Aquimarina brevivitae]|uniref:N-acetylmuramoyl-L-alanine amidase n=1 Tax=Aquimarina brevivitae TaxID=323412 RepID=A0A4Q7P3N9_9FLAO|nr:N-acetylmuramoyl-L-alanine amidase [Aquimarina brevivitae]RZS93292.1 N-acetylmuramoyl-L-alanine amidase [Aquimarina brevivitae]